MRDVFLFKIVLVVILALFFFPFIAVFINQMTLLDIGDLYTFGIRDRKDFYTVWIALFGAIGIAFNINQNRIRTNNQDKQLAKQTQQIELQSKSQRDTRFSKGIELLGNSNESSRMGAAFSLFFLANDYPGEFAKPVLDILCSHIRSITTSKEYIEKYSSVSNEIQTILDLLFKNQSIDIDGGNFTEEDLENTIFSNLRTTLRNVNLQEANLVCANLKNVELISADLASANLVGAVLKEATFNNSNLYNANLSAANLSGAFFCNKTNLYMADISKTNLDGCTFKKSILVNSKIDIESLKGIFLVD